MSDFTYDVNSDFDEIFDEKGNVVLAAREVSWNGRPHRLELRKWNISVDGERASGGFGFLTEEGPHSLTHLLTKRGYGETTKILENVKDREDFLPSLKKVIGNEVLEDCGVNPDDVADIKEEEYFDPKGFLECDF